MIYDISSCPSRENCPSGSLEDIVNSPMSARDAVIRTLRILDALENRHRLCSLHLDICPKNILLTGSNPNDPVILTQCHNSCVPGSPCPGSYTAPELIRHGSVPTDFSTDLYSVAAVFFHCLMGRRLTLAEALQPKAPDARESPALADISPEARAKTVRILRRGLNVLPEKRYRSIGALRRALHELLELLDQ